MNDLTGVKIGFFGTPDFALKFLIIYMKIMLKYHL